jgi:4a-hydroxytetrahydrobiopterin dehydratase
MDLLTDEQITERLAGVPGWTRQDNAIVHVAKLADFKAAILYVGAVAYLAEAANHHPDITIEWNKVTLTLSTHSAGGLTTNDFGLAQQINGLQ